MRIYDSDSDKKVDNIILYLTSDEVSEMQDALEQLINDSKMHHVHVPDSDNEFKKEITVCIYNAPFQV